MCASRRNAIVEPPPAYSCYKCHREQVHCTYTIQGKFLQASLAQVNVRRNTCSALRVRVQNDIAAATQGTAAATAAHPTTPRVYNTRTVTLLHRIYKYCSHTLQGPNRIRAREGMVNSCEQKVHITHVCIVHTTMRTVYSICGVRNALWGALNKNESYSYVCT